MDACLQEEECQLGVVLFPRHQPVGFYVTLPLSILVARQLVRAILGGQRARCSEQDNGILYQLYVKPSLAAEFQVFLEACGVVELYIASANCVENVLA